MIPISIIILIEKDDITSNDLASIDIDNLDDQILNSSINLLLYIIDKLYNDNKIDNIINAAK